MPRKSEPASITENATFPTRLRSLMKERDITQKQLADVVAMRPQTISLYVQGQSAPDINCLKRIAEYFSVSADWLLGLSDAKSTDGDIKAACKITGLSEAALENLSIRPDSGMWQYKSFVFMLEHDEFFHNIFSMIDSAATSNVESYSDDEIKSVPFGYGDKKIYMSGCFRFLANESFLSLCECFIEDYLEQNRPDLMPGEK